MRADVPCSTPQACESGSMFQELPKNMSVFATTAANARESSWGTYCPSMSQSGGAMVDGTNLNSCLGDLYRSADASVASAPPCGVEFIMATLVLTHSTRRPVQRALDGGLRLRQAHGDARVAVPKGVQPSSSRSHPPPPKKVNP